MKLFNKMFLVHEFGDEEDNIKPHTCSDLLAAES